MNDVHVEFLCRTLDDPPFIFNHSVISNLPYKSYGLQNPNSANVSDYCSYTFDKSFIMVPLIARSLIEKFFLLLLVLLYFIQINSKIQKHLFSLLDFNKTCKSYHFQKKICNIPVLTL